MTPKLNIVFILALILPLLSPIAHCRNLINEGNTAEATEPGIQLSLMLNKQMTNEEQLALVNEYVNKHAVKLIVGKLNNVQVGRIPEFISRYQENNNNLSATMSALFTEHPENSSQYALLLFRLFPLSRYPVIYELKMQAPFKSLPWGQWLAYNEIVPKKFIPAGDSDEFFIQPLIESASITIFNQSEKISSEVKYRTAGSHIWQQAYPLSHEPVTNVLTGSIVHLASNTDYELQVVLSNEKVIQTEFTTRPDKPPIDPKKIYLLDDIYSGGTLDIEKLGIFGDENGWAKITANESSPHIIAEPGNTSAINIGSNSYILFENITVKGGRRFAIHSNRAHHLWFDGCDVSGWGRTPGVVKNGIAYESENAQSPINYDAGFYLKETGVVVVENCNVHDPLPKANSWQYGHPQGPTAYLVHANHPKPAYKGQVILRNNEFVGKPNHRYNDIIEGRYNGKFYGAFIRDSAIYNNTFAYSNDDIIELDGSQNNVLVYNNDMSHAYVGISAIPNRIGPTYLFNNYIHHLGDETGKMWTAIKVGGLLTRPMGKTHVFQNYIKVYRNGIAASKFYENSSFWLNVQNNIFVTRDANNTSGFSFYDISPFRASRYGSNYAFNLKTGTHRIKTASFVVDPDTVYLDDSDFLGDYYKNKESAENLPLSNSLPKIPNFAIIKGNDQIIGNYNTE